MFDTALLLTAILLILFAFYKWATLNNGYFERRNIKYPKPTFLFGNLAGLFYKTAAEFAEETYNAFPDEP